MRSEGLYIYITFHPKAAEYTFFSSAHATFSRTDHILGHKTSLNKFKGIEIISSILSDYNNMKLEINHRREKQEKDKHMETKQPATKKPTGH